MKHWWVRFFALNLAALLVVLVAVSQPWVAPTGEVPEAIARKYFMRYDANIWAEYGAIRGYTDPIRLLRGRQLSR